MLNIFLYNPGLAWLRFEPENPALDLIRPATSINVATYNNEKLASDFVENYLNLNHLESKMIHLLITDLSLFNFSHTKTIFKRIMF